MSGIARGTLDSDFRVAGQMVGLEAVPAALRPSAV